MRYILETLQKDLVAHIKSEFKKENINIGVYDTAPVNLDKKDYPFICFGDVIVKPHGCKTHKGIDIELKIEGYSIHRNSSEIKQVSMMLEEYIKNVSTELDIILNENLAVEVYENPENLDLKMCEITQKIIAWEV